MIITLKSGQTRIVRQIKALNATNKAIEDQVKECNELRKAFATEQTKLKNATEFMKELEYSIESLSIKMNACVGMIEETKVGKRGVYYSALEHYYTYSTERESAKKQLELATKAQKTQLAIFNNAKRKRDEAEDCLIDMLVTAQDFAAELGLALNLDFSSRYYKNLQIMKSRQEGGDIEVVIPEPIEIEEDASEQ